MSAIAENFLQPKTVQFNYGEHAVILETGAIARQATAAVKVTMGGTVVLVSAVCVKDKETKLDFFPLMVVYQERSYAAGKIPGGFFKREGRPGENEVLTSRLIDRPIRPLFPKEFKQEIQVIASVLSLDPQVLPDIPALIGASAALSLSGAPFAGPIAGARVGYAEGKYLLNPDLDQLEESDLDLIVAGTKNAVLMVESEANELPESVMLGAVTYGHEQMQVAIDAINELKDKAGKASWDWQPPATDDSLKQQVADRAKESINAAYLIADKLERQQRIGEIHDQIIAELVNAEDDDAAEIEKSVKKFLSGLEKDIVRKRVISGQPRIDGRDQKTVRPIQIEIGALPRAHGSAIFTRGETQAIVVSTLGAEKDAQILDLLTHDMKDKFMLHYNFPPYCVGETGMVGSPKRREIGHGWLAKRAIRPILPDQEDFPYVIRTVSEITESNGSSSMATVCGTSLSLMQAGVPIKSAVAGIAMGLVKEGDDYAILTDILGDEDHLGDMDFKVAGTRDGITALQMDIKIDGITNEIMEKALAQANQARLHILDIMDQIIGKPCEELSEFAPRILTMRVDQEKIRDVIGKGGATIRSITADTGVVMDIDDTGFIKIYSVDLESAEKAIKIIEDLTAEVEVGKIYEGKVVKIMDFGAFVSVLPGKEGLVHISQIANERITDVSEHLSEGDEIPVKVIEIDKLGRIRLSLKAAREELAG